MKFLKRTDLDRFLTAAAEHRTIYVPVDEEPNKSAYRRYKPGTPVSQGLKTTRSAKDFFFPQTENLVGFRIEDKKIKILDPRTEHEDFAVFGVRACDARSFGILDKVFLSEPVDTYYQNRRRHGLILTMTCRRPAETCFCTAFGIDPASPEGDVVFTETADGWYIEPKTEGGRDFLAPLEGFLEERDEGGAEEAKARTRAIMDKLPLAGLKTDSAAGRPRNSSIGPNGRRSPRPASAAGPAPSCARPASATISATTTRDARSGGSAAGTPACIPTSRRWRAAIRA